MYFNPHSARGMTANRGALPRLPFTNFNPHSARGMTVSLAFDDVSKLEFQSTFRTRNDRELSEYDD